MAKRIGLPKKYAKLGFKEGWKKFKRMLASSKRKRTASPPSKPKRKTVKRATAKRKSNPTPKRRKTVAAKKKTVVRRAKPQDRIVRQLTDFAITGGSAVAGAAVVNMVPVVREQNVWIRALAMAAPGIFMMGARNKMLAQLGKGMGIAGAITLILPFMPEQSTVFAGGRRGLTSREMKNLMMGVPIQLTNKNNMGVPVNIQGQPKPNGQYPSAGMDGSANGYDTGAGY